MNDACGSDVQSSQDLVDSQAHAKQASAKMDSEKTEINNASTKMDASLNRIPGAAGQLFDSIDAKIADLKNLAVLKDKQALPDADQRVLAMYALEMAKLAWSCGIISKCCRMRASCIAECAVNHLFRYRRRIDFEMTARRVHRGSPSANAKARRQYHPYSRISLGYFLPAYPFKEELPSLFRSRRRIYHLRLATFCAMCKSSLIPWRHLRKGLLECRNILALSPGHSPVVMIFQL